MSITRQQYIDGMREYLQYLEAHEDAPYTQYGLTFYAWGKEEFLRKVEGIRHGGKVTKEIKGENFIVTRMFRDLPVRIQAERKHVCIIVTPAVYECPESLLAEFEKLEAE